MFRIKICGIAEVRDAIECAEAGADALGLNFCKDSPRHIPLERAVEICQSLPAAVARVGVFVNTPVRQVISTAERLRLDWIQLHGDETPDTVAALAPYHVVKAFRVKDCGFLLLKEYLRACERQGASPAAVLVDAYEPGVYGGTGKTVDWTSVSELGRDIAPMNVVLAGGLRAENVAEAIRVARPAAVDTASGVEVRPGRKDSGLVRTFVASARKAFDDLDAGRAIGRESSRNS